MIDKRNLTKKQRIILFIIILLAIGIYLYFGNYEKKQKLKNILNKQSSIIMLSIISCIICITFFTKSSVFQKSIYYGLISFIIAIFSSIDELFIPFFLTSILSFIEYY